MSLDIRAELPASRFPVSLIIAVILAAVGLGLTWLAADRTRVVEVTERNADINAGLSRALGQVEDVLDHVQSSLRVGASVAGMMGTPTPDQWFSLSHSLDSSRSMPGLVAIGYAPLRFAEQKLLHARVERIERLDPRIQLEADFDLSRDARLSAVVQAAVELGRPAVSVPLDVCLPKTVCLLLATPAFLGGGVPANAEDRIELASGVVFALIFPADTARAVIGDASPVRYLAAYDGASAGVAGTELFSFGEPGDSDISLSNVIIVAGRPWTLRAAGHGSGRSEMTGSRVPWVMAGGMALTALVVMLAAYQGALRRRAERRAAELSNAARQSEQRFRQLSEMSAEWFWETDAAHRFTLMSDGIRATGADPQKFLGRTRTEVARGWTPEQIRMHLELLDAQQIFRRFEYETEAADGQIRRFMISGDPIFDELGQFSGYRGVGRDVTESRRLQRELRESHENLARTVDERTADLRAAKEAAEDANRAKSEFLANMSHELRTPLHAMLSFSSIGLSKALTVPPERLRGYFDKIHTAGERLLYLVNDVLDLSKLEAGRMVLDWRPLELRTLVSETCDELAPLLAANDLHFALPEAGSVFEAEVDSERIRQVLRNLLSNAIKFSRPGRAIEIRIEPTELEDGTGRPAWRISVLDEGIGIPEHELDLVFDKFVQSSKTKTGAGGTGLGLSITREIVVAHGGQIRAYNRTSGGAVFEMILPQRTANHKGGQP